jgi:hypothetical protein
MNPASRSIAFDERRAESYDLTRSLSPERELPALVDCRQRSLDEWIEEARLWLRSRAATQRSVSGDGRDRSPWQRQRAKQV